MATCEADVGTELTLVKGGDGIRSLPESVPASEWRDLCLLYERERARADEAEARAKVAEAHAAQWRRAEIAARGRAGCWQVQCEASRDKLNEARAETEAIRRTAKEALSLQAEVRRLRNLVDAAGMPWRKRPSMVSLRKQVGRVRRKNAALRARVTETRQAATAARREKNAAPHAVETGQVTIRSLREKNAALRRKHSVPRTQARAAKTRMATIRSLGRKNAKLRKEAQVAQAERRRMAARIEALEAELAELRASRAVLSKALYGRKSEQREKPRSNRRRGQRPGAPGHGRTPRPGLGERIEVHRPPKAACVCGGCGTPYAVNGAHDTTLVEIEVKAHKRRIVRPRWRRQCDCEASPREVTAAAPDRLFPRTPHGTTVWACVVFERHVGHRPLNGVAAWLSHHGLPISAGTLAGGLARLASTFEGLSQAILEHQNEAPVRHGDETGWRVQSLKQAGRSPRAWLWVSVTADAVCFHIDPSRSAEAALRVFGAASAVQALVVDRLSAYKKLARVLDGRVILAWCWAHQRRDFIDRAAGRVELTDWCRAWLERIASIYRLNKARLSHCRPGLEQQDEAFADARQRLQTGVEDLFATAERELAGLDETAPEAGPLRSPLNHRKGLSVFLERPDVPMDNNFAERTLRGAVIARRLSFGSDSLNGARCTAMMYSAVETLALNGIDVRRWLNEWLAACAGNGGQAPPDLSEWLPWSMSETRRRTLMAPE